MTIFSGKKLFQLKDRHGLPIDMVITQCIDRGVPIDWVAYIAEAKSVGRSDKWINKSIDEALQECLISGDIKEEIGAKFKKLMKDLTSPMLTKT